MNEELLKIYEDNTNEYGLPVFDLFTWQNINTQYLDCLLYTSDAADE